LERATANGYLNKLKSILDTEVSSNKKYEALMIASGKGYTDIVKLLLDKGANPNVGEGKDGYGYAPLNRSTYNHHADTVKILLEKGALVDHRSYGLTALHYAMVNAMVIRPIEENPPDKIVIDTLQALIDGGADINAQITGGNNGPWVGRTVLHMAVVYGHADIVTYLLDRNAKKDIKGINGFTPLKLAEINNKKEIISILSKPKIFKAVEEKHLLGVMQEISKGVDINAVDESGNTPLMLAAQAGSVEIVHLLIEKGADVNKYNDNKLNALILLILYQELREVLYVIVTI